MPRTCTRCHKEKEITEFRHWIMEHYVRVSNSCKECANYQKKHKKDSKTKYFNRIKTTPEQSKESKLLILKYEYGYFDQATTFRLLNLHSELNITYEEVHLCSATISFEKRILMMIDHLRMLLTSKGIYRHQIK